MYSNQHRGGKGSRWGIGWQIMTAHTKSIVLVGCLIMCMYNFGLFLACVTACATCSCLWKGSVGPQCPHSGPYIHSTNWAGFRKGRGTRDQIANICWIIEKAREFQKNIYFCLIDYTKTFVWITTNRKVLKEIRIPDLLTCLLRNLYAGQETTVRTRHGTTDQFKIGKGVHQGCILSPCLFI